MPNRKIETLSLGKYTRIFKTDTPLWSDLHDYFSNPSQMNKAEFNLICSKRDISLWTKLKMKPHRNWKVSDAKTYFNIKGTGEKLLADFMEVFNQYQELKAEMSRITKSGNQLSLTA
jgi:hypothetical protein|tara:strand:+ start:326 stop:676 length:351 start_codon:yes stop_codon:yes gene_type:complete